MHACHAFISQNTEALTVSLPDTQTLGHILKPRCRHDDSLSQWNHSNLSVINKHGEKDEGEYEA